MSERHAIFLINNIRLIRLVLTVAAILPVLILPACITSTAGAIGAVRRRKLMLLMQRLTTITL